MKLPLLWLRDYLDADDHAFKQALADACRRWELQPHAAPERTLATLFTFAGFNCDGVEGTGADAVLELDVLSNRPDGQCVFGLAREAAAILRLPLKSPEVKYPESGEQAASLAKVTVEEPALCPRYTARVIRGVKIGPSPEWFQKRLTAIGLVPRNNVVDVTNFVLFELNQPLHAFDLNKLAGKQIVVRRAKDKEAFTPLYATVPPLTNETLVIADAERAVALAGVIGGAGSEVTPETTDILLESAYFDPANTRRTSRRVKVTTDSSYRFERGIDREAVERASARAAKLICELGGGKVAQGVIDSNPEPYAKKPIEFRMQRLNQLAGFEVPKDEAASILKRLGCTLHDSGDGFNVEAPSWRRGDLDREVDLIEEVLRIHGYNHVPTETKLRAEVPNRSDLEVTLDAVRARLAALGYFECMSDSMIDPRWPAADTWTKSAPLKLDARSVMREDHSALRTSLLPSLLEVQRVNLDKRTGTVRIFEAGNVYLPIEKQAMMREERVLALLDETGFQSLAEAIHQLAECLELNGAHLSLRPAGTEQPKFLAPGTACKVVRVRELDDKERAEDLLGWIGMAAPAFAQGFGVKKAPALAELSLNQLAKLPRAPRRYAPLPTQPEVVRDVALVVSESVQWQDLRSFATQYGTQDVLRDKAEAPRFLSVFRGKQIGDGKKSVAFSVVYRHAERSLTDEEVNAAHQRFVDALLKQFQAVLRA